MISLFRSRKAPPTDLLTSCLYNEGTFYPAFIRDLKGCQQSVIIESPFITAKRMASMLPILKQLTKRGIRVVINTRSPEEHDGTHRVQAEEVVANLQELDVLVLFTVGHHRKLAIIDKTTVWEGSLNILSHNDSCEIMRRTESEQLTKQMFSFLRLKQFYW
jgi:hypothetical protein